MLKNYFKIALRNLRWHPGTSLINLLGLAVGMACCLLIFLFVRDELSYDTFHAKSDRIYRVVNTRVGRTTSDRAVVPPPLGPTLTRTFPEVQTATRFFTLGEQLVQRGEQQFFESGFLLADSTVFEVFSFRLLQGDPSTALRDPLSVVLTETMAEKYFPNGSPIGQTLDVGQQFAFTVTGVMADPPEQSHLQFNFIGSITTLDRQVSQERLQSWIWQQFFTYVLLEDGARPQQLEAKLPDFIAQQATPQTKEYGFTYRFHLQPLTAVHLHSANIQFDWIAEKGNITYVYAFSLTALFILLIACFNFMNLATARSMQRAREVGMRKALGAHRSQLIRQFLGESFVLAFLALAGAVVLATLVLPVLNGFTGKTLTLGLTERPVLVLGLIGAGGIVGFVAGSYPALYLSRFRPSRVFSGFGDGSGGLVGLRKGLVVAQFAVSIGLIVATGVVFQQLDYVRSKNLGFDKERIVTVPIRTQEMRARYETIKAELKRHPAVERVTASYGVPGRITAGDDIRRPGSDTNWPTRMMVVDHDYTETYGLNVIAGRDFSAAYSSDRTAAFMLNETAARELGWTPEEAVGQQIEWDEWEADAVKHGQVIGVVEDFHFASLHQPIEPLVLHVYPPAFQSISVRIQPGETDAALAHVKSVWAEWAPDWPFEYESIRNSTRCTGRRRSWGSSLACLPGSPSSSRASGSSAWRPSWPSDARKRLAFGRCWGRP